MRLSRLRKSAAARGGAGGRGAGALRAVGPGDRAAAHGADRAPAPSSAGPARWRDGPGPEDWAARGSRCGHIGALTRGAASTPWLLPGRRATALEADVWRTR